MSVGSHVNPTPGAPGHPGRRRGPLGWRVATPLVVLLAGALFVVSGENSDGTDLRPGRYTSLAQVAGSEAAGYAALQQQVSDLNAQVTALTTSVDDNRVRRDQRRADALKEPAGLSAVSGPGVTVTLSDAPDDVRAAADKADNPTFDPNLLVVHQQDIQAVVNAMWRGGATAISIQGQRLVSTTGIKCEGNSIELQGVPYPEPFVISAVGDPTSVAAAIEADPAVTDYRAQAADPTIDIGFEESTSEDLTAPAYDGLLDLTYATPLH